MKRWITTRRTVAGVLTVCLLCCATAEAKKPDKPGGGGGGETVAYTLVDLQGLPGWALQSNGQFLTHRNAGAIMIAGNSHLYSDSGSPARLLPVLWHVDGQGNLSPDSPINLGLPSSAAEIEVMGINRDGVIVSITRIANSKDDNNNWVFPSFVDIPGMPYQEIPIPAGASRNTWLDGINDNGQIIGSYVIPDPNDPDVRVGYNAVWQVEDNGSISGPYELDFFAEHINSHGVMAGHLNGYPAIAWFDGETLRTVSLDTSLRFFGAEVEALNDLQITDIGLTVVGQSRADEDGDFSARDRGFAWRPNQDTNSTTILGTFDGRYGDSAALDVNNSGQIVGWSDMKMGGQNAFIYINGQMKNLNSMVDAGNKTLNWAKAINNDGDITGFMKIPRPISESHGFLLRPIE